MARSSTSVERDELLARVIKRGTRIRRIRRIQIGIAAIATIAVLCAIGAATILNDRKNVSTSNRAAQTATRQTSPTTAEQQDDSVKTDELPQVEPGPTAVKDVNAPGCRNSTDPSCGPFHWDPAPENEPMELSLEPHSRDVKVGEQLEFRLEAADDSSQTPILMTYAFGDGPAMASSRYCEPQPKRYGPWTPPPPDQKSVTHTLKHSYSEAGTYTVRVTYSTQVCDEDHEKSPYGSRAEASVVIRVTDA